MKNPLHREGDDRLGSGIRFDNRGDQFVDNLARIFEQCDQVFGAFDVSHRLLVPVERRDAGVEFHLERIGFFVGNRHHCRRFGRVGPVEQVHFFHQEVDLFDQPPEVFLLDCPCRFVPRIIGEFRLSKIGKGMQFFL